MFNFRNIESRNFLGSLNEVARGKNEESGGKCEVARGKQEEKRMSNLVVC
jgi:hypothetical protein